MALTGVLNADFSSFLTAVQQAETKLVSFQSGAAKVEGSLNKMVDAFSGRQIITQGTLMTEAVARAGGAAVLTAKEMARVNATVSEAIAKYAALGQTAPANMIALADATKRVEVQTQGLSTSMVALGTFIGTMATQAVTALARLAVEGVQRLASGFAEMVIAGAGVADVTENFSRLTAQVGLLGGDVLGQLRAGTHNTITDFELMKSVNAGLAAGMHLTTTQMSALAKGAFALAQATGGDVKTAFDTMNDAMLTGRTRAVALLTGKIDLEAAEMKYAAALGILRKDLTATQQLEAARAAILDGVTAATQRLGEQTDGLDEKLAQAVTWWTNLTEKLGAMIATSPVVTAAIDSIARAFEETFGGKQETQVATIAKQVDSLAITLVDLASVATSTAKFISQGFYAARGILFGVFESVVNIAAELANLTARTAEMGASLPVVGAAWQEAALGARAMVDQMEAVAASFKFTKDEAFDTMGTAGAAFDSANEKLTRMRAAMEAASKQPVIGPDVVPRVQALAAAATAVAQKVPPVAAAIAAAIEPTNVWRSGLKFTSEVIGELLPNLDAAAAKTAALAEALNKAKADREKPFTVDKISEANAAQLTPQQIATIMAFGKGQVRIGFAAVNAYFEQIRQMTQEFIAQNRAADWNRRVAEVAAAHAALPVLSLGSTAGLGGGRGGGGRGGGGVVVQNTFNVVDTEANIVRRVSDQITRSVMNAAKLRP